MTPPLCGVAADAVLSSRVAHAEVRAAIAAAHRSARLTSEHAEHAKRSGTDSERRSAWWRCPTWSPTMRATLPRSMR